jgi:hypothetical protein
MNHSADGLQGASMKGSPKKNWKKIERVKNDFKETIGDRLIQKEDEALIW